MRYKFLITSLAVVSFIFYNINSAQATRNTTCGTTGPGRNCTNEQPAGQTWYWCGNSCRTLPTDPGVPWSLDCSSCQWTCQSPYVVCNNSCVTAASNQGHLCGPDGSGRYGTYNACGVCANYQCPSAKPNLCNNQCQSAAPPGSKAGCAPGQDYDVCTGCTGPGSVILNPAAAQQGYVSILGDLKSGSDLYLADGRAIRVDGTGATNLNIGNWGGGNLILNVSGDLKANKAALGGYNIDTTGIKLTTPSLYAAKVWIGAGSPDPGTNGLSVSGNILSLGNITGANVAGNQLCLGADCKTSWAQVGATLPSGADGQTLRYDGTNWVANSGLIVDSSGKVGIGIQTPGSLLSVNSNITGETPFLSFIKDGNQNRLKISSTDSPEVVTRIDTDNTQSSLVLGVGWGDSLVIAPGGKIGINTGSPAEALEVNSFYPPDINTTRLRVTDIDANQNPEIQLQYGTMGDEHWGIYIDKSDANKLKFWNNNNNAVTFTSAGDVIATGILQTPQIKITNGAGEGKVLTSVDASGLASWQTPAAGGLAGTGTANYVPKFLTGTSVGDSSVFIDTAGNVGIGTTTAPGAKLDVNGTIGAVGQLVMTQSVGEPRTVAFSATNPNSEYNTVVGGVYTVPVAKIGLSWYGNYWWLNAFRSGDSSMGDFSISYGTTDYMRITSGGNVGIGTPTPSEQLEVRDDTTGTARLRITDTGQNPELQLQFGPSDNQHWGIYVENANKLRFWSNSGNAADGQAVAFTPNGDVIAAASLQAPQICFGTDGTKCRTDWASWVPALNMAGGTVTGDRVGIGGMSATALQNYPAQLVVVGNIYATGSIACGGTCGTGSGGGGLSATNIFANNGVIVSPAPIVAGSGITGTISLNPATSSKNCGSNQAMSSFDVSNSNAPGCISVGTGTGLPAGTLNYTLRYGTSWVASSVLTITDAGNVGITTLAGTGSRMVVANASGVLTTQTIPTQAGDNLGDHILTKSLNTNSQWISGDGTNNGIFVASNNNVGIGTTPTAGESLKVNGIIRANTYCFNNAIDSQNCFSSMPSGSSFTHWADQGNGDIVNFPMSGAVGIGGAPDFSNSGNKLYVKGNTFIDSGNLQLSAGKMVYFTDNGVIKSKDNNHQIVFDRINNKMKFIEYGSITFAPGATDISAIPTFKPTLIMAPSYFDFRKQVIISDQDYTFGTPSPLLGVTILNNKESYAMSIQNISEGNNTTGLALFVRGNVVATGSITPNGSDIAEWIKVSDVSVEAGDVLVVDKNNSETLDKSDAPYSSLVAGIVSENPGILGGFKLDGKNQADLRDRDMEKAGYRKLALAGRVLAKVSAENGAIEIGDLLTTSSTPGYAMKATDKEKIMGAIVGKALESLKSGKGKIMVLVTLQ